MRFCSRCGLPLSGLAEWLAGGGVPAPQETQVALRPTRQKKIRRAKKLMFLSGVLFPVFLAISRIVDDGGPMIVPVVIFLVSLFMLLYARHFVEEIPPIKSQQAPFGPGAVSGGGALPPANIPIYNPGNFTDRQVRTNELAQPPSVTENTTRLLDED